MVRLQQEIGPGGLLIANPIPKSRALDAAAIEARISEAVQEAKAQGVGQKEVTPFLLRRVVELTDGRSLEANMALVKNNADRRRAGGGRTVASLTPMARAARKSPSSAT